METPELYKKIPLSDVKVRNSKSLTTTEKERVDETINKFFELFIKKHLS